MEEVAAAAAAAAAAETGCRRLCQVRVKAKSDFAAYSCLLRVSNKMFGLKNNQKKGDLDYPLRGRCLHFVWARTRRDTSRTSVLEAVGKDCI